MLDDYHCRMRTSSDKCVASETVRCTRDCIKARNITDCKSEIREMIEWDIHVHVHIYTDILERGEAWAVSQTRAGLRKREVTSRDSCGASQKLSRKFSGISLARCRTDPGKITPRACVQVSACTVCGISWYSVQSAPIHTCVCIYGEGKRAWRIVCGTTTFPGRRDFVPTKFV